MGATTMRAGLRVLILALALVAVPATVAGARVRVGANVHAFFRPPIQAADEIDLSAAGAAKQLDRLAVAGADAIRLAVHWPLLEPRPGQPNPEYASYIDATLKHAKARGLEVVLVFGGVQCGHGAAPTLPEPGCQSGEQGLRTGSSFYPESDPDVELYAATLANIVKRYRGTIIAAEPGNEPNHPGFLLNPGGPVVYAKVLRAAYRRIKLVAPEVTVLAGALALNDPPYLERLYDAGIAGSFDAVSVHPYDLLFSGTSAFGSPLDLPAGKSAADISGSFLLGLPALHKVMRRHGDGKKKLWLTEFGYHSCPAPNSIPCVGPQTQRRWTDDSFRLAAGRADYIDTALVYLAQDYSVRFGGQMGMIGRDGKAKPVFGAVSATWKALRSRTLVTAELRKAGDPLGLLDVSRLTGGKARARFRLAKGRSSRTARLCVRPAGRPARCVTRMSKGGATIVVSASGAAGRVVRGEVSAGRSRAVAKLPKP